MWLRRAFLRAAGASFAAGLLPPAAEALDRADLVFASAIQKADGRYGAALLTERGEILSTLDLPDRGHDITWSPATGQAVVFARQPGTFAVVFDPAGRSAPLTLSSAEGRHFFGHGVFSPDGRLLYATENDFDRARGVIGVFDATDGFRRIGEFDTYGTGPHEMLLLPDGHTFSVANGGIETHPGYGRTELNLDTMDPSLCFIDRRDGTLVGQLRLDPGLHQLSIRHMAADAKGRVWFGCQYRGAAAESPQLVGFATRDGDIRLVELPSETLGSLRNYVGSLAASADGETIGVSSPEGNVILALDAATTEPVATLQLENGCGIAPEGSGFLASSGLGVTAGFAGSSAPQASASVLFDNHLRGLGQRL